jgi:hypothetical protein
MSVRSAPSQPSPRSERLNALSPPGRAAGPHQRADEMVALGVPQVVVDDFASHRWM